MSNLIPFTFEGNDIRTITDETGAPWFVLRDLLGAMGTTRTTTQAIESIDEGLGQGYTKDIPLQTTGGIQTLVVVAEPAVTYLLSRSNTEAGRRLNRFIHAEVLPAIRQTGRYDAKPTRAPRPSRRGYLTPEVQRAINRRAHALSAHYYDQIRRELTQAMRLHAMTRTTDDLLDLIDAIEPVDRRAVGAPYPDPWPYDAMRRQITERLLDEIDLLGPDLWRHAQDVDD